MCLDWGYSLVIGCMLSLQEALSSIPDTKKRKRKTYCLEHCTGSIKPRFLHHGPNPAHCLLSKTKLYCNIVRLIDLHNVCGCFHIEWQEELSSLDTSNMASKVENIYYLVLP